MRAPLALAALLLPSLAAGFGALPMGAGQDDKSPKYNGPSGVKMTIGQMEELASSYKQSVQGKEEAIYDVRRLIANPGSMTEDEKAWYGEPAGLPAQLERLGRELLEERRKRDELTTAIENARKLEQTRTAGTTDRKEDPVKKEEDGGDKARADPPAGPGAEASLPGGAEAAASGAPVPAKADGSRLNTGSAGRLDAKGEAALGRAAAEGDSLKSAERELDDLASPAGQPGMGQLDPQGGAGLPEAAAAGATGGEPSASAGGAKEAVQPAPPVAPSPAFNEMRQLFVSRPELRAPGRPFQDIGLTPAPESFNFVNTCEKIARSCNKSVRKGSYRRGHAVDAEDLADIWKRIKEEAQRAGEGRELAAGPSRPGRGALGAAERLRRLFSGGGWGAPEEVGSSSEASVVALGASQGQVSGSGPDAARSPAARAASGRGPEGGEAGDLGGRGSMLPWAAGLAAALVAAGLFLRRRS